MCEASNRSLLFEQMVNSVRICVGNCRISKEFITWLSAGNCATGYPPVYGRGQLNALDS